MLIILEKLFGTYYLNDESINPDLWIVKDPSSYNPITIFAHEYCDICRDVKKSPDMARQVEVYFHPPEWSRDHSTKTAKQLQSELTAHKFPPFMVVALPKTETRS